MCVRGVNSHCKGVCQGELIASLARCVSGGNATGKVCVRGKIGGFPSE
uniref:Uncharacterized protein n=1 Tax=Escherichia coli TaxID=562 RepID=A0A7L8KB78_ECOLX|nr:hypothetical protein [Escherichia coli]